MPEVNEIYEIELFPSDWNAIVTNYNSNRKEGRDTLLERNIAGKPVQCKVTGYSWKEVKKPFAPQKQKILVEIIGTKK